MLMGKAKFKCSDDYTEVDIPAQCIETFCIGKNFPLAKSSGHTSIEIREGGIELTESEGTIISKEIVTGNYIRDEDIIHIHIPVKICNTAFKTKEKEGEVRIEVEENKVIISKI
jgi:ferric-dicitrate binding protein FerR (iron transport regulator)